MRIFTKIFKTLEQQVINDESSKKGDAQYPQDYKNI